MTATADERQREYWEREHGFRRFDHPVVEMFAEQRLRLLASWLELAGIRRALDVGCGDGFSTFYMRRHVGEVWATDRSGLMLARHPLRGHAPLVASDARALPYAGGSFDLVYGWEILHHVSDPTAAVAEMARVSSRYVLVMEPNRNNPAQFAFALFDPAHRWVLRYSRAYLERVCLGAGLRIARSTTGGYVFPNRTPLWMAHLVSVLPYRSPIGVTNCVLAVKP